MPWTVETAAAADAEIEALPVKLQARLIRLLETEEVAQSAAQGAGDRQWAH